jgi:hypothetical protein
MTCFSLSSAVFALALLVGACGGSGANSANRPLPSYAGHATELFDDALEPKAVGLDLEQPTDPRSDPLLRERAQIGDASLRVRVSTVTTKAEETGSKYQIGVVTLEKLAGPYPPAGEFNVVVDKNSPAIGIMKSFEGRMVGKTFVIFIRLFVRPDGDRELHFHLAPDTKPVLAAVKEATAKTEY